MRQPFLRESRALRSGFELIRGSAIPSSGSEAGSSAFATRDSRTSSPLDSSFSAHRPRSRSPANALLYDDPRSTHHETPSSAKWDSSNYPRRPGLLKAHTDERVHRTVSPSPGPGHRARKEPDKTVRANVLATRKSGGRVGAMAKGPDGKYAVGGGMGTSFRCICFQMLADAMKCSPQSGSDLTRPKRYINPSTAGHHARQEVAKGATGASEGTWRCHPDRGRQPLERVHGCWKGSQ